MGSGQGPKVDPGYQLKSEGRGDIEVNLYGFPASGGYWMGELKHKGIDFSEKGKESIFGNCPLRHTLTQNFGLEQLLNVIGRGALELNPFYNQVSYQRSPWSLCGTLGSQAGAQV